MRTLALLAIVSRDSTRLNRPVLKPAMEVFARMTVCSGKGLTGPLVLGIRTDSLRGRLLSSAIAALLSIGQLCRGPLPLLGRSAGSKTVRMKRPYWRVGVSVTMPALALAQIAPKGSSASAKPARRPAADVVATMKALSTMPIRSRRSGVTWQCVLGTRTSRRLVGSESGLLPPNVRKSIASAATMPSLIFAPARHIEFLASASSRSSTGVKSCRTTPP
mmetsp:Transcript_19819/g.42194  ORF Transcript_19819/g.42194 Transcript_19819/m.42194 type:complete len:219 (-) Transcript_19819:257-913(-)